MFAPLSSFSILVLFFVCHAVIIVASASRFDTFVYGGCSKIKYVPNSQYESNVNSLLTTLVNSAMYSGSPYNKFTTGSRDSPVYGLYQCRSDLPQSDCSNCMQHALSQLGVLCPDSCGGAIQLDGCFVKYDNATFIGVEDKTEVVKKCGPPASNSDELGSRDQVLGYLASLNEFYRVGSARNVQGVAQCVGDLSLGECKDCVGYAIQRLKSECGSSVSWGDMFLGKCYVRIIDGGSSSNGSDNGSPQDSEIEKTLAILVGLIAGGALLIVLFAFVRKLCDGKEGK